MPADTSHRQHQFLLSRIFAALPPSRWFLLRQKDASDTGAGVAKALHQRQTTIDALLVNAGLYKENGNGFSLNLQEWQAFTATLPPQIQIGDKRGRTLYVANKSPAHPTPAKQEKANVRITAHAGRSTLPFWTSVLFPPNYTI